MRINTYLVKMNEDRIGELVKERGINYGESTVVDCPEKAAEMFERLFDLSNQVQEFVCLLALDGGRKVSGAFEVTRGTLTSSLVHPREIFQRAILSGAASIIIAHNHPSGTLMISEQDRMVTKRNKEAGEIIGISLDDHIICGDGSFVSAM